MKKNLLLFLLVIPFEFSAQYSIGSWRDHFPFNRCIDVCEANNFIYAATANSVFSYDQFTGEIMRYNKTNTLSDVGISALEFDPISGFVVVGYSNGNIDLFNDKEVYNIPFVKFSTLIGDKTIYNIYPFGNLLYLSTGFGIVVVDVLGREIKETYFIGSVGDAVRVKDIAVNNQTIYAVTEQGLRIADVNNSFLANFENWSTVSGLPGALPPNQIEFFDNQLVLAVPGELSDTVWSKPVDGTEWVARFPLENFRINQLWSNNKWFSASGNYAYWYSENNLDSRIVISMVANRLLHTFNTIVGYNGYVWAADKFNGLMLSKDPFGFEDQLISPQGPNSDDCRRITAYNNSVWIAHGGVRADWGNNYNSDGVSAYIDDAWVSWTADTTQSAGLHFNNSNQFVMDFMDFAVDPIDNNVIYGASWEEGLVKIDIPNRRIIPSNGNASTGPDSDGITDNFVRTAVGGVAFSDDGILWCTNGYTKNALHALDREGTFYDYDLGALIGDDEKVADILISNDGYVWANVINKGLLVLNNNGTLEVFSDDNFKLLTDVEGNGKLPSKDVLCMEEDLDGEVWVGTASGLSIFYNPPSIFSDGNFDSEQILIQQEGNTQILLETEAINCIEIDGSNRKWIGTKNSGAYLFSDDGLREVYHFTEENSPLPSNTVYDIGINHSNGEVYFATENGVVGFFSTATNFDNEMSNVRVFPNPVRPDYEGNITIDGLAYNTSVKITDIQGNILFETESEGGRAVWNGLLTDGSRPATGVYLVYVSTPLGTADEVRKLTFVR